MKVFTSDAELAAAIPNSVHEVAAKNGVLYLAVGLTPGAWEPLEAAPTIPAWVPQWVRYRVSLAQMLADAELNPSNFLRLALIPDAQGTFIHDAMIKPVESFAGTGSDVIVVSVGSVRPGQEIVDRILNAPYFGDGAGIEDDPEYITYPQVPTNYTYMNLYPGQNIGHEDPTSIHIYFQIPGASSHADYEGLTAGAVDVWLLQSVRPTSA